MNRNLYVAIMAGGIGSRFWPKSRASCQKQFIDILNTGKTLIQSTYERYQHFVPKENIYVVTTTDYIVIVQDQLQGINIENIVSEPCRKNTAPSIAYISFKIIKNNPEAILIVAPLDHLILDNITYEQTCAKAIEFLEKNNAW